MKIKMPTSVKLILNELNKNNKEAYIVGGCVRDAILKKEPKDWDITTSAKPNEVIEIFKSKCYKVLETGIKHGTVTVMINDVGYEITTYRMDGQYSDSRHPDSITYAKSLLEDLSRRDFRMNAIAYNEEQGIIDHFKGLDDLKNKTIHCVGNSNERFSEDGLRMMRAARFSAQLGFKIAEDVKDAAKKNSHLIQNISKERISEELNKILVSDNPEYIYVLHELGLLKYIMPEFINCIDFVQNNPHHIYNLDKHIYVSLKNIKNDPILRWTMLLHDIGKPNCMSVDTNNIAHFYKHAKESSLIAESILKRLKRSNEFIDTVVILIKYHDTEILDNEATMRKWLSKIGESNFRNLLLVKYADIAAQNPENLKERKELLDSISLRLEKVLNTAPCLTVKDLAINGNDLKTIGYTPGKEMGAALKYLLEQVIENPDINTKETLLNIAAKIN